MSGWGPTRSTTGISSLVRFGDMSERMPDALIETPKAREEKPGIQDLPPPDFHARGKVRVVEGPMAGYQGIYQAKTTRERLVILLEIVGQSTRVKLADGHIDPASS